MQHHTKSKGDLGVLKAQADLCQKGFLVCLPLSEHAPFDLVVYKDNSFRRVQVKTRTVKSGSITVRFEQSHADSKGTHIKRANLGEIDLYCIYCIDKDTCYYFGKGQMIGTTFSLRVEKPKNNQIQNVNFADDYKEVP